MGTGVKPPRSAWDWFCVQDESRAVSDGPSAWAADPVCSHQSTAPLLLFQRSPLIPLGPPFFLFLSQATDFSPDARRGIPTNQRMNRCTSLGKARNKTTEGETSVFLPRQGDGE